MNIKEAIAEIEKRYKVGDEIPCLAHDSDALIYRGVNHISKIEVDENDSLWVSSDYGSICKIHQGGKWSKPIREKKNLWSFFKSIEGTYPDVAEKYLRNLNWEFILKYGVCLQEQKDGLIFFGFDWERTNKGDEVDYWKNIDQLYEDYLNN